VATTFGLIPRVLLLQTNYHFTKLPTPAKSTLAGGEAWPILLKWNKGIEVDSLVVDWDVEAVDEA
jgi:hypothetical protein